MTTHTAVLQGQLASTDKSGNVRNAGEVDSTSIVASQRQCGIRRTWNSSKEQERQLGLIDALPDD